MKGWTCWWRVVRDLCLGAKNQVIETIRKDWDEVVYVDLVIMMMAR